MNTSLIVSDTRVMPIWLGSGMARGGTSLIAAALRMLGVYMGDPDFLGGNHEDYQLSLEPNYGKRKREIDRRNKKHDLWGMKSPIGVSPFQFDHFSEHLRNPRLIVILRDNVATSRWRLKTGMPVSMLKRVMRSAAKQDTELSELAYRSANKMPVFVVSMERAIKDIKKFLDDLENFVGRRFCDKEVPLEMLDSAKKKGKAHKKGTSYLQFCPPKAK